MYFSTLFLLGEVWAAVPLYWYQTTHPHFVSGQKCRWSVLGRNVGQAEMWAAVSLYWYQTTDLHFGSGPKCSWSFPGRNVGQGGMRAAVPLSWYQTTHLLFWEEMSARERCGLLFHFIDTRRLIRILGAGKNVDGVCREEMSARERCGLLSHCFANRRLIRISKMQMEFRGEKPCADGVSREEMLARERCGLLSHCNDTRRLIRILGACGMTKCKRWPLRIAIYFWPAARHANDCFRQARVSSCISWL